MVKRIFIVHGWSSSPQGDWFPWLASELRKAGYEVHVPKMPNPDEPDIYEWISALSKSVGKPDKYTYFVGHSIGCQTILRYLAALPKDAKVGGAVYVAGWFSLTGLETEEEREIAKPWIKGAIDLELVMEKTKNAIAIFSDNDPFVPVKENKKVYEKFCKKVIVEKGKGHINTEAGITQLLSILKAVLEVSKV